MDRTVYFDNNATTRTAPEVRDVMLPFLGDLYGNPSSMHAFGGEIARYVARAREEAARFINCSPEEIIFTSCATESDNTALRGTAEFYGKDMKIVTTAVEHPAVLQPARRLKANGWREVELPVDGVGQIDPER
ncbi:MAG TPA: cysteine desulfurase NifS, partial [Verrucomicrobia bacterium]|nr:cysteine desulfurase NifS [Verrucomicrobiota bacterium]